MKVVIGSVYKYILPIKIFVTDTYDMQIFQLKNYTFVKMHSQEGIVISLLSVVRGAISFEIIFRIDKFFRKVVFT